ncbi:MAG: bifunctional nuclease family protein [Cyanobacteria bacterium]|nr:bifunctional nuclease family protein [Cyanobacteria bacterium CG_2015-16_32_12]NCO79432.1 bifunctional nuclease family protein [Cyanobacteria bacterium CG_2015-22_32_23]NCQ42326.1 bifunctional nuclease family protein [Cyanobacteria bacterium CG_2015-04_32_10]NCS85082.1 bifunctional nuclease family protein [Cyanobacteria bacterium CG_2015-02_32_10]
MIEMKVAAIALDAVSRTPIVLLKDASERRALPIYVGQDQARSIIGVLEQQEFPRPLTHDLMVSVFSIWNLKLEKVIINSLQDNTFYALLCMKMGKKEKNIDCRPSDAIAIAVRIGCPIWVMEEVLLDASIPVDREADEEEREAFRDFVANLSPDELIRRATKGGDNS